MALYLVIGFSGPGNNPEKTTCLYSGNDGEASKKALGEPNEDFPLRHRYVNPTATGGRVHDRPEPKAEEPSEPPASSEPTEPSGESSEPTASDLSKKPKTK